MSYIYLLADRYQDVLSILNNIFGIAGFMFGIWRYLKQRKAQILLKDRQHQLDDALARLAHLKTIASKANSYSAAV
jgi:hypothetical protein